MKTPNDVQEEGFNSLPEDSNPYEKGTWAWKDWNIGRENGYSPKDYKQEFAEKLINYKAALNTLCNAKKQYADAIDSFNDSLKCYRHDEPFVISCDNDLNNGWLVEPYSYKLKSDLDAHRITPLKHILRNEPFEYDPS